MASSLARNGSGPQTGKRGEIPLEKSLSVRDSF